MLRAHLSESTDAVTADENEMKEVSRGRGDEFAVHRSRKIAPAERETLPENVFNRPLLSRRALHVIVAFKRVLVG